MTAAVRMSNAPWYEPEPIPDDQLRLDSGQTRGMQLRLQPNPYSEEYSLEVQVRRGIWGRMQLLEVRLTADQEDELLAFLKRRRRIRKDGGSDE